MLVGSLVRELRSHLLCAAAKKKKKSPQKYLSISWKNKKSAIWDLGSSIHKLCDPGQVINFSKIQFLHLQDRTVLVIPLNATVIISTLAI